MKYCTECGNKVTSPKTAASALPRLVCRECKAVFYQSPRLAAGCIAEWNQQILLCRRAIEPGRGLWELPAGFVASGESARNAAVREMLEEANVAVEIQRAYAILHIPHVNQLRILYLARLLDDRFSTGAETLEAKLFEEARIPWGELAFATTRDSLRHYFKERAAGLFSFFFAEIVSFDRWES